MLPGGVVLTTGALAAARFDWSATAWGAWAFLAPLGSLVAFTTYLQLIAVWGPTRAGSYAYVSPVIAVLLGVVLLGEHLGWRDGIGMGVLLAAAFCSLRAPAPETQPLQHS